MSIHPTAVIEKGAQLADGVEVGPYSIIGANVSIGKGTVIGSNVCIDGFTEIGSDCRIFHGAVLGKEPQDLKFKGEKSYLKIGNGNVIREFATMHRATGEEKSTIVGDNNYIMAYVHVAHNCRLGSGILISNATSFAGHVQIEDKAVIGGMTGVHQFVRIGKLAMVGGCARIVKDVPPFSTVTSSPARFYGLNVVGLRRNAISSEIRNILKRAYTIIRKKSRAAAIEEILTLPKSAELDHLLEFIQAPSSRGISFRTGRVEKEDSVSL